MAFKFENLKIWQLALELSGEVSDMVKLFPKDELYSLTNQLRRSASSIPANIAEGCGKNSQSELAHFLNISLGSANKTEYFLLLSKDLNYLPGEKYIELDNSINGIKAMLISLINKVRNPTPKT